MKAVCVLAVAVGAALPLCAEDGILLAESAASPAFSVYSVDGAAYAVASAGELAALPPVTWRAGETVTATARDGTVTTLADGSTDAASAPFPSGKGGVWTLVNSVQGTARVGVAWSVYDDGGTLASGASSAYGVDSLQDGSDRKTNRASALPVAYTGNAWARDADAESTLTFTEPSGAEMAKSKTGTGAEPFKFSLPGQWKVALAMADETTLEATITIVGGGFSVVIR